MAKVSTEHLFIGQTTPISSYDSSKTSLGTLMRQRTGANNTDKWAGPMEPLISRLGEIATVSSFVHVYQWSSRYNWIFTADNVSANLTRRINFLIHDKVTDSINYNGFVTMNFVAITGNKTIRGLRALVTKHTSGTVSVSGTTVTGSSTKFSSDRIAVGARIGFGSSDPTQITSWYEISAINSDTSITLTSDAGIVAAGSNYVIEELRIATSITNATTTNGGLFLMKGLRPELFASSGTNINEATTIDNQRAIYWLADASTVTNITACGLGIDDTSSPTSHFCWVLDLTGPKIYKYNLRAALTSLSAGKSTSALQFVTGISPVTGTVQQSNNGRIVTASHGPGNGIKSFYFVTSTRVYRCDESAITNGSTTWITDVMLELPTGGINTFAASGGFAQIDYSDSIDRFFITYARKVHITQYRTDGAQFDHIAFSALDQLNGNSTDVNAPILPNSGTGSSLFIWTEGGYAYIIRANTSANSCQLFVTSLLADWQYASSTSQRIITPKLSTNGATKFYRAYVNSSNYAGANNLMVPTEPYRMYVRTSGIEDNTGDWTLLDDTHSLTSIAASNSIQFMFEFRTIGHITVPSKIYGVTVLYEDATSDSHYQPSISTSSINNKRFGWRHSVAFGSSVPNLRVRLYDAVNGNLLVDDNTSSPSGTFERSTDNGSTWSSWTNTDKSNENTYIRYIPASLGDNIKVRAVLTLL